MANCVPCQEAGRGPVVAHYSADPASKKPAQCWHCRNTPKLPHPMDPARRKEEKEVEKEMATAKQKRTQWDPDKAAPANVPEPQARASSETPTRNSIMCQCKPGCEKMISRPGGKYAWGHTPKKVSKKMLRRLRDEREPAAIPNTSSANNGHKPTSLTIESLTRAEYEKKYGAATAWISEELRTIMQAITSAQLGDVVVVVPPP